MKQPFGKIIACFRCKHAEGRRTTPEVYCHKWEHKFDAFDACSDFIDRDEETEATK